MLSLQECPLAEDLKQQVAAVSRDVEGQPLEGVATTPTCDQQCEDEVLPPGQVEYYVDYCLDRYALTYKTQVLYPNDIQGLTDDGT